ncbi:MAG TPA: hypothetical protein VF710_01005, partial [Longimicrobium sp.]
MALLAYLVLEGGEYPREKLTRLVWRSGAAGSIDTAISELRAVLGSDIIPPRARRISVPAAAVALDALQLVEALVNTDLRERAIALYRGPFLDDFKARGSSDTFVDWIAKTRASLENAFQQLCDAECVAAASAGRWERVLEVADHAQAKSPDWARGSGWRDQARQVLTAGINSTCMPQMVPPLEVDNPGHVHEQPAATPALPVSRSSGPVQGVVGRAALAGLTAALLMSAASEWIRGSRRAEPLVRMPPIHADELPAPGSPVRGLSDWMRTDGRWIYYRYEQYMPGACHHKTMAVGNFDLDGWDQGVRVVCLNSAWLAVDGQLLVERFSLAPETTYCLQFLYVDHGTSYWGQHGAQRAPGLDSIRVVAPGGEYNIGWAILRGPVG